MPPGGATFDENSVPLGQGGTSGGFRTREQTQPSAAQPLSRWFDPSPTNTALQPPPPWPLARHPLLD
jgi:hypothetical protein